tara:strand:+ start:204 stop:425 length:222 start_codon:yes stop_codon:yes gene_type:complete
MIKQNKIIINLIGHDLKIMSYFFVPRYLRSMCQSAKAQNYGQYGQVPKCQTVANVPHHKIYLHLTIDFFTNTI